MRRPWTCCFVSRLTAAARPRFPGRDGRRAGEFELHLRRRHEETARDGRCGTMGRVRSTGRVVTRPIAIHIVKGEPSRSIPGEIWLDADLLDAGEFAWGVVQHEYAHQVDYLLFDDLPAFTAPEARSAAATRCHGTPGLAHDQYGCERFALTLAWSFWPSPENSMRPTGRGDESAAMAPAKFRALVSRLTRQTART